MDHEAIRRRVATWNLAESYLQLELRNTTTEHKFQQLCALFESAVRLGWETTTASEVERVRDRWNRLRELAQHESLSRPENS